MNKSKCNMETVIKVKILLVGIDSFEKIRKAGFHYGDKTKLIEQIFLCSGLSYSIAFIIA